MLIPTDPLAAHPDAARQEARRQGNPQEDHNGLGNLPHREGHQLAIEAEPAGKNLQIEPTQQGIEQHLQDRIDRHQHGRCLPIPLGQIDPDQHHGNAGSQANHDQPRAQGRLVGQKPPGQAKHQQGTQSPHQSQRQGEQPPIPKDHTQLPIAHLRQDRIQHHQQTQGNGHGCLAHGHPTEHLLEIGHNPAQQQPGRHGQQDPKRQQPIQP